MPHGKTCYCILSSRKKHLDEFKRKAREAMHLLQVYINILTRHFNFLCLMLLYFLCFFLLLFFFSFLSTAIFCFMNNPSNNSFVLQMTEL